MGTGVGCGVGNDVGTGVGTGVGDGVDATRPPLINLTKLAQYEQAEGQISRTLAPVLPLCKSQYVSILLC